MKNTAPPNYSFVQKALAFSVHIFTASGLIAAILAIIAISDYNGVQGMDELKLKEAMLWLLLALFIDGIDGTFARLFKTKEVLPNWDGQTIDYVIDFATYAIIPAFFIYEAQLLPEALNFFGIACILLVSALYYGKKNMVSDDYYFVGFPVMWNVVAFALFFVFDCSQQTNFILVMILCAMHFIPIKYPYPSRVNHSFWWVTLAVTVIFFLVNLLILYVFPKRYPWMIYLSFSTGLYYTLMSLYVTFIQKEQFIKKNDLP